MSVIKLSQQRNSFLIFAIAMLVSNIVLGLCLYSKNQRIVIDVPPGLKTGFWMEGEIASPSYLKEMALFVSHLMLDKNSLSQRANHEMLLSYVAIDSQSRMASRLLEDEARYKAEGLSTIFYVQAVKVFLNANEVIVKGDVSYIVSSKKVKSEKKSFKIGFGFVDGRWKVIKFEGVQNESN